MADIRIPRGYGKVSYPYKVQFQKGVTPSYPLRAAKFLPVWSVEAAHDDVIVIPPGTFIGRLNAADNTQVPTAYVGNGALVPACPVSYVVTYSAYDLATGNEYGGTPDIDQTDGTTVVAATGDGTAEVGIVKPLGIAAQPIHAGWYSDRYENYQRQLPVTWMSHDIIVRIPCMTTAESAIEAGDLVMLDDSATPKWAGSMGTLGTPGRLMAFNGGSFSADSEFVVGRCVNKVLLGKQATPSTGQTLQTAIGTSAPRTLYNLDTDPTYLWPEGENFEIQSKTETVPGLGLASSSATLGRSAEMLWSRADASGYFYALDILIRV